MKNQKHYFNEEVLKGGIYGEKEFYGEDCISYSNWSVLEKYFFFKGGEFLLKNGCIKSGQTMLIICGGIGHEAEYFRAAGLDVTNSDYSEETIKYGMKIYPNLKHEIQNAENLTYKDNTFDYCYVRAGLHHLERPIKAIYEMERVSRLGFGFQEAHDSSLMRLLVRLGYTADIEPAGNYVYRFQRRELEKLMCAMRLDAFFIKTWIGQISPKYRKGKFSSPIGQLTIKAFMSFTNIVLGGLGNNFLFYCQKRSGIPEDRKTIFR
jgi:ubiquinone/menaquinone biosynthesis C-methylase UbiE